jgi:hypothetical protein
MKPTYLMQTTTISAQTISDRMPKTFSCVTGLLREKHCANAYSGLVPISPEDDDERAERCGRNRLRVALRP